MKKVDLSKIVKNIRSSTAKHAPEILTGVGIVGMIGTTIMAVKATPKAMKLLEEKRAEKEDKLTPIEVVQTTWRCYMPAAATGVASAGCLIKASSINTRRNAALVTAYNLSRTALTEYKEKVIETIGEKKEQVIKEKIAEEKLEKNPVNDREIIITDTGTTLCYDGIFGRYFTSNMDTIKRAAIKISRNILSQDYVSLNEFYDAIGLDHVKIGDDLGWNTEDLGYDKMIDVDFSSKLTPDGRPCLVIEYRVAPRYGYSNFF